MSFWKQTKTKYTKKCIFIYFYIKSKNSIKTNAIRELILYIFIFLKLYLILLFVYLVFKPHMHQLHFSKCNQKLYRLFSRCQYYFTVYNVLTYKSRIVIIISFRFMIDTFGFTQIILLKSLLSETEKWHGKFIFNV